LAVHSATLPGKHGIVVSCVAVGAEQSDSSVSWPGACGVPGTHGAEAYCVADGVAQAVRPVCAVSEAGVAESPQADDTHCGGLIQAPSVAPRAPTHCSQKVA
jgi:hypothetical protein